MKVLAEADAVWSVEVLPDLDYGGWTVWITYAHHGSERREALERQRGGVRVFSTLEAVARAVETAGLSEFRVRVKPR